MPPSRDAKLPLTRADAEAVRAEVDALWPCRSWECDDAAEDGSVEFRCQCGRLTGRYPSYVEGEHALGEHLDVFDEARRAHLTRWALERMPDASIFLTMAEPGRRRADTIADRVRRRPQPKPVWPDDFPRVTGPQRSKAEPGPQFGLAHLLVYRMSLVGVLSTPLRALAEGFGLRVERSFGESYDCDIAYFEHEDDAFALVRWEPTQNVEVCAYVPRGADGMGVEQLERFLELAGLSWDDVVHPPRFFAGRRTPTVES